MAKGYAAFGCSKHDAWLQETSPTPHFLFSYFSLPIEMAAVAVARWTTAEDGMNQNDNAENEKKQIQIWFGLRIAGALQV